MDLSPRGAGRLIDDALALYGANIRSLAKALAVAVFPVLLFFGIAQVFYYRGFFEVFVPVLLDPRSAPNPTFMNDPALIVAVMASSVLGLAYAAVKLYFDGALYASAPGMIAGERPGWKQLLVRGKGVFVSIVIVQMLVFGITYALTLAGEIVVLITFGLGLLALVPALVYASTVLSLAMPAVVIERCSVTDALKRSYSLVRGDFWRVFWLMVAIWFITLQIESAIISPLAIREVFAALAQPGAAYHVTPWAWKVVEGIGQALAVALVLPISGLSLVSVYLDMRSRREGMDLLIRAERLAPRPEPPAAAPVPAPSLAPAGDA